MKYQSLVLLLFIVAHAEECAENTCHGRGNCYSKNQNEVVCICSEDYTGERCEYEKVDCTNSDDRCIRGTCLKDHCKCPSGYAGPHCEYTDQCRENPCRDHGKCLSIKAEYRCLCDKGYTSSTCEKDVDECKQNPHICQNGGVCQNTDGSFKCKCPAGYDGQLCGYDINDCDPQPCLNSGRCIDGVSDFRCECPATYSGKLCEVEASDCGCEHGTCSDHQNSCICDLGWMGYKCDEKITSCEHNPCQNGTVKNQVSQCKQYTLYNKGPKIHCLCATGLTGDYCEKEFNLCDQNPCRGQGECSPGSGGTYQCACYPGYTDHNCETDINECETQSPCKNGGKCTNQIGSYFCDCKPGYGGMDCEIDIDDCASEPCLNGGTCVDGEDSYTCNCAPGYYNGSNCEIEIDECENNNCPSYSICVDKLNHFRCICQKGSDGMPGCEVDENECTANLCKNAGVCNDLPGDFSCECLEGYSGKTCQFDNTACGKKPCLHGTCYPINITSYQCDCHEGYIGDNCEVDFNECLTKPCKNSAKCIDQVNDYFCDCPPDYTGKDCNLDTRYCKNNPCENGGVCLNDAQFPYYKCGCREGYTGVRCREEKLCEENICANGGKCISLAGEEWKCECPRGYTGERCHIALSVCSNLQCYNGGSCISNKCQCTPGYTGPECRSSATSCADKPCRNGGTCDSLIIGGFECTCGVGYYGEYCELASSSRSPCSISDPCLNSGTCIDNSYSYTCRCRAGYSGRYCEIADLCYPNPCKAGYVCENFPPENPQHYMCCEETRAICYKDGCPLKCEDSKNNSVCEVECYNAECSADRVDCSQNANVNMDPWKQCPHSRCKYYFKNGICNEECNTQKCNYDGMDCRQDKQEKCQYEEYCRLYYNNNYCDQGCNNTNCNWDGTDCLDADNEQVKDGIKISVNVGCERVRQFKAQLTYVLDIWSNAISVVDSMTDLTNQCDLIVRFDTRYCMNSCITVDVAYFKQYLWASLQSNSNTSFPFKVVSIEDAAHHGSNTASTGETVSTAIICTIATIALLLLIVGVVVGRNVIKARARLWRPADFKTNRKRNIKDISTMGEVVHLKGLSNVTEHGKFGYYLPDQTHSNLMDVDLDSIYLLNQHSVSKLSSKMFEDDETSPMITQAAYEYRHREDTASPTTQAEEQVAVGQKRVTKTTLGRGETAIHVACRNNRVDELRRLLVGGLDDINATDSQGRTPLYAAVGAVAVDTVDLLLEQDGIDVDKAMDQTRATPLILAAKISYNVCLEKLLKARAQVNLIDCYGRSALHWAAAVNNIQAIELLIHHGANKDCQSAKLETPLFLAAREGNVEAVKLLVCKHAARHICDTMDQTPIDVARDRLHTDIEEILMTWNMDGNTVIKQPHHIHPGSLTPPQSDDAATGSPNSLPTLSPCDKETNEVEREEKKGNKRKKKKTDHNSHQTQQPMYQNGYWAKNQLNSPPWLSTQMLSPESLQGSPTSTNIPKSLDNGAATSADSQQRLSHYPYPGYIDNNISPQGYIPQDQMMLTHKPLKQYNQLQQLDYHSSPDSPEDWTITSPPTSDWSHTSP